MIIDLAKFAAAERGHWQRLEDILERRERDPWAAMSLAEARELDYLYRRTVADLARVTSFSAEPELRRRLERLVARAYAEVHGVRGGGTVRIRPWVWLRDTLPQTFRRQWRAAGLALLITVAGVIFGGLAMAADPDAKQAIMPFSHLLDSPADRVAKEEAAVDDPLEGRKADFAGELMTHNTQVALLALALGMTCGVGTVVLLFYNGVILGAVVADYLMAGQTSFLFGWLLPHGVIEIPAILVGGQAGLVLARALLGREDGRPLAARLRAVVDDVATLGGGAGLMLVWAGLMESYLSQYHEPVIPYALKIGIGLAEAALVGLYFASAGRPRKPQEATRG